MRDYSIGGLAREAGCKAQTIRYYETIGLMPEPPRTSGNRRVYGEAHLERLKFIRLGREFGFSLDAIRDLLGMADNPDLPCCGADEIARAQLDEVEKRIRHLESLRGELVRMIESCRGGKAATCRVIEALANPDD